MVNKREGKRLNPIQVGLRADMAALEALVGRALKWVGGRQIPRAIGQRSSEHNRGPMKASVRTFHSPDVDLVTHRPGDPGDVGVLIQILAGPSGGPGEESFDVLVCTPRWLDRRLRDVGPIVGRHYQIGGADRYLIDPRNRAFAFVFGHYIYTLDGGGQL